MQIFMEYSVSHTVTSRELVRASSAVSGAHSLKERSFMKEKNNKNRNQTDAKRERENKKSCSKL